FYYRNDGLQDQSVLYWSDSYDGAGRVLIDPNSMSEDGTVSLGQVAVSDDGRLAAYCRKQSGSDWSTIRIREIETGRDLSDELQWARWGNIVWNADATGFYYSRYPTPEEGEQYQAPTTDQRICFHKLGEPQSDDQLVFYIPEAPTQSFWISRTDDDQYLLLSIARSTDPQNQVRFRRVDAALDAPWTPIVDDFENQFDFIGNDDAVFYFLTDFDAPTKRLVAIDVANDPSRDSARQIVPAVDATLVNASYLGGKLICQYLADVVSRVEAFTPTGESLGEIELPGVGAAAGFSGKQ
ncbi:MAG: S9 family peptidase, partial [Planctomycetota bacterium]